MSGWGATFMRAYPPRKRCLTSVLRAAELLGKQYGLFGDREGAPTEAPKIVMDVPGRGEKK